ncbi:MAG: hypothetical protein C3F02_02070 [Parcubacteria group bacterium]|nr:MAG: hypothetical protein C3F02_02070 [Parcubacteria group bacterium]
MIDFKKFLDLHYLFAPYADPLSTPFKIGLLTVFILSLVFGLVAGLRRTQAMNIHKRGWRKWQVWGWSTGLVGLLLVAFRETRAAYLGSRLWLILWLLLILVWGIFIIKYWFWTIPRKKKEMHQEAEFKKWLPKNS